MHRHRWAAVAALATISVLGMACSSDDTSTEATPTTAATAAGKAATAAPASATAAAAASAAVPPLTPAGADGTVKAVITGFKLPALTVKAGTVVEFTNQDTTGHTATSDDGKTINSGTLTLNGTPYKFTASAVGAFPYACQIHPSMTATITIQ